MLNLGSSNLYFEVMKLGVKSSESRLDLSYIEASCVRPLLCIILSRQMIIHLFSSRKPSPASSSSSILFSSLKLHNTSKPDDYAALGLEEIPEPIREPNFEEKLTEQLLVTEETYLCPICGF